MDLVHFLTHRYPNLKKDMKMAGAKGTPDEFIDKNLKNSLIYAALFTVLFFFVIDKAGLPIFFLFLAFMVFFYMIFRFSFLKLKGQMKKREREINREVLFVGRYLLVKLYSGRPLLNALLETSQGKGIVGKSIKEIVNNIDIGTPIEKALEEALLYSPSEKFKKILFQINNALKLGIDVTGPLESVIEEITEEEEIEVKRYGKKLNSLIVFYMLIAIVAPSIGVVMLIIVASFLRFPIDLNGFLVIVFFIAIIQIVFISMFRSVRPTVDI